MDDMLSQILNDPEKLKGAISMAASMLGGDAMPAQASPPAPTTDAAPSASEAPPPYRPPAGSAYDPSAELMQKAMPVLMQIARSGQNAVSPQKLELLHALKPFVAEHIGIQIDHGLRLVSIAQMAHAAMQQLRAGQDGGATHV